MLTVHKFPFQIADHVSVEMPEHAEMLSIQYQAGVPTIWALVDPEAKKFPVKLRVFRTGHPIPSRKAGLPYTPTNMLDSLVFLATIQSPDTRLVWHVFEVR